MPSIHGPQWDRDEEFRQSVIRKALLLGFEAHQIGPSPGKLPKYQFTLYGNTYGHYASMYSAAYEFMRLKGLSHLAGKYHG